MSRLDVLRMAGVYGPNQVVLLNKYNVLRAVGPISALLHPQQADRGHRKLIQVSQAVSRAAPLSGVSVPGMSVLGGRVSVGKWDATITQLSKMLRQDPLARDFFRGYIRRDNVQLPFVEAKLARGTAFYLIPEPRARAPREAGGRTTRGAGGESPGEATRLDSMSDSHNMAASREEVEALVRECVAWELEKHLARGSIRRGREALLASMPSNGSMGDVMGDVTRERRVPAEQTRQLRASTPLPGRRHSVAGIPLTRTELLRGSNYSLPRSMSGPISQAIRDLSPQPRRAPSQQSMSDSLSSIESSVHGLRAHPAERNRIVVVAQIHEEPSSLPGFRPTQALQAFVPLPGCSFGTDEAGVQRSPAAAKTKEMAAEDVPMKAEEIAAEAASIEADEIAAEAASTKAEEIAAEAASIEADEIAAEAASTKADEIAAEDASMEADEIASEADSTEAEEIAVEAASMEADEIASEADSTEAEEIAAEAASMEADEIASEAASMEADEIAAETASTEPDEITVEDTPAQPKIWWTRMSPDEFAAALESYKRMPRAHAGEILPSVPSPVYPPSFVPETSPVVSARPTPRPRIVIPLPEYPWLPIGSRVGTMQATSDQTDERAVRATPAASGSTRHANSEPAINLAGQVVEAPKLVQPRPLVRLQPTQNMAAAAAMITQLKDVLAMRGRVE